MELKLDLFSLSVSLFFFDLIFSLLTPLFFSPSFIPFSCRGCNFLRPSFVSSLGSLLALWTSNKCPFLGPTPEKIATLKSQVTTVATCFQPALALSSWPPGTTMWQASGLFQFRVCCDDHTLSERPLPPESHSSFHAAGKADLPGVVSKPGMAAVLFH